MGEGTVGGYTIPMCTWMTGGTVVLADDPMFNDKVPPQAKPTFAMLSAGNLDALLAKTTADVELFPNTAFIVGGSPVAQQIMERARRRLSRRTGMVYGSTETGSVTIDMEEREVFIPHCVGYVVPQVEAEVVDDHDVPVPPVTEGHVRIRADYIASEYVGDPEATARHFRDGWFYPGDLGVFSPQGLLVITGRTIDLFNFGGVKIAPIILEEVALACPGVTDTGACKLTDAQGELAVVAVTTGEGYDPAALARALKERFGKFRIAIAVLDAIPRNRMGKIERRALAEAVTAATETATRH
jgi:acyl-CoA synthetase (AMP-forming)/AMP-acid ligase II